MTFASITFFLFFTLFVGLYYSAPLRRHQNWLVIVASYGFYAWWDYRFCALMAISALTDYWIALGIAATPSPTRRRWLLGLSLVVNLGMLGFFKYFNFFVENAVAFLSLIGFAANARFVDVILPVGISFYTFQTLSYSIDVYRGEMKPSRDFAAYMAFVSFFPQLVAGPIERARALLPQFETERRFDYRGAVEGCRFILWGLFKKMVLADRIAVIVDSVYQDPTGFSGTTLAVATILFGWQIYLDFSAYSDIAIGTARILDVRLMRNFAYPYFSQDVSEFWRRWHISLSTWFRDYVFIPLGGTRQAASKAALAVLATFTISGIWHGASWNFVIWGALNGLAVVPAIVARRSGEKRTVADVPGGSGALPRPAVMMRMLATYSFINLTWIFFRAQSFDDAALILARIMSGPLSTAGLAESGVLLRDHVQTIALLAILVLIEWLGRRDWHPLRVHGFPAPLRWATYTAIFWLIVLLGTYASGPFIYFQF